jgi:hypothetical protein
MATTARPCVVTPRRQSQAETVLRAALMEALRLGSSLNGLATRAGVAQSALHRFLYPRPGRTLPDNIRIDIFGKLAESMDLVLVHKDKVKDD